MGFIRGSQVFAAMELFQGWGPGNDVVCYRYSISREGAYFFFFFFWETTEFKYLLQKEQ